MSMTESGLNPRVVVPTERSEQASQPSTLDLRPSTPAEPSTLDPRPSTPSLVPEGQPDLSRAAQAPGSATNGTRPGGTADLPSTLDLRPSTPSYVPEGRRTPIAKRKIVVTVEQFAALPPSVQPLVAQLLRANRELVQSNLKLRDRLTTGGSYLPDWIDATAELPDADTTVLVAWTPDIVTLEDLDDPVEAGYFDGQIWRSTSTLAMDPEPTHWMPFPEPPDA